MFVGVLLIAGILVFWSRLSGLARRVENLEGQLRQIAASSAVPDESVVAAPPVVSMASARSAETAAAQPATETRKRTTPVGPPPANAVLRFVREYFTGGNVVVRVGIIVLFFGVAFLLKYAAEHTRVPIELRLTGVAVGAMALFVAGWRLRLRRRGFSFALQGGAIGTMYLTVFAAFRLYHLLPAPSAFALLALVGTAAAFIALSQDALSLAVLGTAGGFLAPVLASTGQGSHVALFSYYALLDFGIVMIAWFKAWRPLNLLAFVFTFGIGTLWGVTRYEPAQFTSTEPFLVFFFLSFVAISVLFAFRRAPALMHYVDGTLVFRTPVVALGLQLALVRDIAYGRAFSALTGAAIYVSLAWWLHRTRRDSLRLLVESFLALGIALITLAVPLTLDGQWTAATWALEGVAVFWMGLRQQRWLACASGAALQWAAAVAFVAHTLAGAATVPVWNPQFLCALIIGIAGLVVARMTLKPAPLLQSLGALPSNTFLAWGLGWWLYAALSEVQAQVAEPWRGAAALVVLTLTAAVAGVSSRRVQWPALRVPALLLLPSMLLIAFQWQDFGTHPFDHGGWVAWPLAFAVLSLNLKLHDDWLRDPLAAIVHVAALWLLTLLASWEVQWQVVNAVAESSLWGDSAWALVPSLILGLLGLPEWRERWPMRQHRVAYDVTGSLGLVALLACWSLWINAQSDGSAAPLAYLPLLNPLDIANALALAVVLRRLLRLWRDSADVGRDWQRIIAVAYVGLVFVWLNGVLLRTMHHWAGIPYRFDDLFGSTEVQTAFSIFWTLLALGAMLLANRKSLRFAWFGGAALMAAVLAKLFLVDLARVGTVPRIVSFIGVGALMLVIGYYSPLPPPRLKETS